MYDIVADEI